MRAVRRKDTSVSDGLLSVTLQSVCPRTRSSACTYRTTASNPNLVIKESGSIKIKNVKK